MSNFLYLLIGTAILLPIAGLGYWIMAKKQDSEPEINQPTMLVNKRLFKKIKNNDKIRCMICNKEFGTNTSCEFSAIMCPKDNSHIFHYECFIKEMGKPSRCAVCQFECLKEFYEFKGELSRSLLINENIKEKFSLMKQQVVIFNDTLGVCLLDDSKLKIDELSIIAKNLNSNGDEEMRKFASVLSKCGQMNEIFEISKRELFNRIIAGSYPPSAFYPIYFNSNYEMINELSSDEIVKLLTVYCINPSEIDIGLRLAYLTIFLTRMTLKEKQFTPEDIKELLLAGIKSKNTLALGVIWNYVSYHPYVNFEKFRNLLKEAINHIDKKDLPFVFTILKDYYKDITINLLETLKICLGNQDAVCSLFGNQITVDFLVIWEILKLYKNAGVSPAKILNVVYLSILNLSKEYMEAVVEEVKSFNENEPYIQVLTIYFLRFPPSTERLIEIIHEVNENEICDLIYIFGTNKVISVEQFIEIISKVEKRVCLRMIEGGEYIYSDMNEAQIQFMAKKCREMDSVEHILFFLHRMTEEDVSKLSETDVKLITEPFSISSNYVSTLSNIIDSSLLYMRFEDLIFKIIDATTEYDELFSRVFKNQYFEKYVDHNVYGNFIYKVLEHKKRRAILIALFNNCEDNLNYGLLKMHLVERLLTTKQSPIGNSLLDQVLRNYDSDSYMELFRRDMEKFVSLMMEIDDEELLERIDSLK